MCIRDIDEDFGPWVGRTGVGVGAGPVRGQERDEVVTVASDAVMLFLIRREGQVYHAKRRVSGRCLVNLRLAGF